MWGNCPRVFQRVSTVSNLTQTYGTVNLLKRTNPCSDVSITAQQPVTVKQNVEKLS